MKAVLRLVLAFVCGVVTLLAAGGVAKAILAQQVWETAYFACAGTATLMSAILFTVDGWKRL